MNSISAAGEKFEKTLPQGSVFIRTCLVLYPSSFSAICGFTHTHFHVRPLRSMAPINPIASGEGVLQRQRMRFRSPVPALFLPLPSLFPSLPPDHLLFSIGPHAIMRGAQPAAFPLCPFSLMGIRRSDVRGASVSPFLSLSH